MGKLSGIVALFLVILACACAPTAGGTQQQETPPVERERPQDGTADCEKSAKGPAIEARAFYFFRQHKKKNRCEPAPSH